MGFDEFLSIGPYSLGRDEKKRLLSKRLIELTKMHADHCEAYADMLDCASFEIDKASSYEDLPFIPVRLFKQLDLKSVPDDEIVKTMTSSGTTGQATSKIYLDRTTSANQQRAMVKIVSDFTGSSRMPMIIIDSPSVLKDRNKFSARGAGILGFSIFGAKKIYALDNDMNLDVEGIKAFLEQNAGKRIFLFGFTFMIWQYFYKELVRLAGEGVAFDLSGAVMIHGGGWKKLQGEAVSPSEFHDRLQAVCGLDAIHDYYGMVEQTGCIYMQCECGRLHASCFSDVIARRPGDFSVCDIGEPGVLQVLSAIPESYPGHSLLTEDEGVILGEDDCPCGRKGKYFKVLGRIKEAEIRGCSDTYAAEHAGDSSPEPMPVHAADAVPGLAADRASAASPGASASPGLDCILRKVAFLAGSADNIAKMANLPVLKPFCGEVMSFLSDVSKELMADSGAKLYPDVATLGFWLRRGSLENLKKRFISGPGAENRVGRGAAFHVAPSNVPVNYAYSLFTGLLCGNANIVRIPARHFPQEDVINRAINKTLSMDRHEGLRPYVNLVRYDRDKGINDFFSGMCDVRIIWGGDATVAELRKSPIGPRCAEVAFSDRYSLAVIDSDYYMRLGDKKRVAHDFYNDTYLSDQNACTSPRAVVWLGGVIEEARAVFWENLRALAAKRYDLQPIQGVDKLSTMYLAAANVPGLRRTEDRDNLIYRIRAERLPARLMEYRGNSGYFYEYACGDVMEIRDFCNDVHCQTIGLLAERGAIDPLLESGIKGVDRVVPIGHTMDFDLIWDGYDLSGQLTRTVAR